MPTVLTKTTDGLILADDFERAPTSVLGGDWTERSGSWDLWNLPGGDDRLRCADTTNNRFAENDAETVGRAFGQAIMRHDVDQFPAFVLRFNWGGGSFDGYAMQIGPTGGGVALLRLNNGAQTLLDGAIANSGSGSDHLVQLFVDDSEQQGWWNGVTYNGTDATHDAQDGTFAARHGYSPLSGTGTAQWSHVIWCRDRIITVSNLPVGYRAEVLDSSASVVRDFTGPTLFEDFSHAGGCGQPVPIAGWAAVVVYDTNDDEYARYDGAVYPGDIFELGSAPSPTPSPTDPVLESDLTTRRRPFSISFPSEHDPVVYKELNQLINQLNLEDHFIIQLVQGAPTSLAAAAFILASPSAALASALSLTDSATIAWDTTTIGGQVSASVRDDSITYAKLQNVSAGERLLGRGSTSGGAGDVEEIEIGAGLAMDGRTLKVDTAASVGAFGLLVQDGATNPPVNLYLEDGTDWLYADGA